MKHYQYPIEVIVEPGIIIPDDIKCTKCSLLPRFLCECVQAFCDEHSHEHYLEHPTEIFFDSDIERRVN